MATPIVNSRTCRSIDRSRNTGRTSVEIWLSRNLLPHDASATPSAAPVPASTALSVNSCRTSRQRDAPSATRRLNSCRRAVPRAKRRLAMLAQAITSTSTTTTMIVRSGCWYRSRTLESPVAAGVSLKTRDRYSSCALFGQFSGSVALRICRQTPRTPPVAVSIVCSGFSRATMFNQGVPRRASRLSLRLTIGSVLSGTITSNVRPTSAPKNSGGMTPTTVNGTFSSVTVRPSAVVAPSKYLSQNPWLMTATGPSRPPPRWSSASENVRPTSADTPRVSKNEPLARNPSAFVVTPLTVKLARAVGDHAADASNSCGR